MAWALGASHGGARVADVTERRSALCRSIRLSVVDRQPGAPGLVAAQDLLELANQLQMTLAAGMFELAI